VNFCPHTTSMSSLRFRMNCATGLTEQASGYDLLFSISAETLLEIARDPAHWEPTLVSQVLHSWNQKLEHHPHIHWCLCRPADCLRIAPVGIPSQQKFFFRSMCWQKSSEVSSERWRAFDRGELGFTVC